MKTKYITTLLAITVAINTSYVAMAEQNDIQSAFERMLNHSPATGENIISVSAGEQTAFAYQHDVNIDDFLDAYTKNIYMSFARMVDISNILQHSRFLADAHYK